MIRLLRKLTPAFVLRAYHYALAWLAHVWYGMPSRKMCVIGVTGTKGKTTTCHLIADLLEGLGKNVGMTSSVQFRVGDKIKVNDTKQGMPGRFRLQKLLREMVANGCEYAVIETTSEGMLQYRHRFVDYNMAVFTNLSPEHIERHGGFEKYRGTKVKLFEKISRKKNGVGVYNLDDENVEYFLAPKVAKKIGFSLQDSGLRTKDSGVDATYFVSHIRLGQNISEFDIEGIHFQIPLVGEFNVYNAAAAIAAVSALDFSLEKIVIAAKNLHSVVGRSEIVQKEPFMVIVDYAHEPRSLEAIYKAVRILCPKGRLIGLLGAQGGGRDTWKRPAMGKIAAQYCDEIVLTNEDPYDEIPQQIIDDIERGVVKDSGLRKKDSGVYKIVDRREAIQKVISLAKPGDVVVLSGKGGEVWMCVEGGKKIPWDERKVAEEALGSIIKGNG